MDGEALAMREGILAAQQQHPLHVIANSDNLTLISYLADGRGDLPSYVPRVSNTLADALARKALSITCSTAWPISNPWLQGILPTSSSSQATLILHDLVKESSSRNSYSAFRTFCTAKDLSAKKCVPCNTKDLRSMTKQAAEELIPKVPGWSLLNEGGTLKLNRSWKVKTFIKGLELFQAVADIAEAEGHHPDLHLVGWNNVTIEIWTHAVGGLTENDFILASKISALDLDHLLRRKAAAP